MLWTVAVIEPTNVVAVMGGSCHALDDVLHPAGRVAAGARPGRPVARHDGGGQALRLGGAGGGDLAPGDERARAEPGARVRAAALEVAGDEPPEAPEEERLGP